MNTAIYSLYQRHELKKMRCFIAQVLPSLNEQCKLHILINDEDCPDLRAYIAKASRHITVHWEGRNLGVAGGRNLLIRRALGAGAEFFISCDTDIIYETSYFDDLRESYRKLASTDPHVGFIQPVLLDGREVRRFFPALHKARNWDDVHTGLNSSNSSWRGRLFEIVREARGLEKACWTVYHSGICNIWAAHFGTPPDEKMPRPWLKPKWLSVFHTKFATFRSEIPLLEKIMGARIPVRVTSTAGGVSAFHKNVIEEIGDYDEIFNPFGYEDSEMGFRSTLSGRNNYLIPTVLAIHDIFLGESNRSVMSFARLGLLRGVELAHPNLSAEDFSFACQQSLLFCWRDLFKYFADEIEAGRMAAAEATKKIPDFALSYIYDLARGVLHSLGRHGNRPSLSVLPILMLLRGFLGGEVGIADFRFPLGLNANFVAGHAVARRRNEDGGSICSFFASNCRIEESTDGGLLNSRYFDLACVSRQIGKHRYRITVDIQSDDETFAVEMMVTLATDSAHKEGSIRVDQCKFSSKQYDFGKFSIEEIYPLPTLYRSASWLGMFRAYADRVAATAELPCVADVAQLLMRYLVLPTVLVAKTPSKPVAPLPAPKSEPSKRKRVLVFADSRGQHKPVGCEHLIFGERLAADPRLEVDIFLCPMKWTTTLDFLERFDQKTLAEYDHVILYTGIVDWSPRKFSNAKGDLYDSITAINEENWQLNTREYTKKIVNNKKRVFDEVFGTDEMTRHFQAPFDTLYEGEKTINMYSVEMARRSLLPRLSAIPNLIFITANRFVDGWNGDYRRQRPTNIVLSHDYSDLFAEMLPLDRVIDLRQWSNDEVKIYTCDNLHLTQRGSDFIYERIMKIIGMPISQSNEKKQQISGADMAQFNVTIQKGFSGMHTPERITPNKKPSILAKVKRTGYLATLVIGVRVQQADDDRSQNLKLVLDWIDYYYGDLFDVLLVEQDIEQRLDLGTLGAKPYVRRVFIYNPREYNRGWGYNVALRHFCNGTEVAVLMDTDVLTGANFLREVLDCYTKYDAISPYQNIYYTDAAEVTLIKQTRRLEGLSGEKKIKNPVTLSGGILIVRRDIFLALKGFEQYVGYGCEDRALDVTFYNHIDHKRLRIASETYAHLYHPSDSVGRTRFDEIYAHLTSDYNCKYESTLGPYDFIHSRCSHVSKDATQRLMIERAVSFGDMDLYRHERELAINGIVRHKSASTEALNVIFPPDFVSLETYARKELYETASDPDSAELAKLYNAFKGKRCFIIGNGPSLNKHDLSLLEGEYSFGVNSFYYKTRETGFRPYFYVVEDSSVMKENIEEIRRFDTPYKFFPTNYRSLHPKQPNTYFFRMNRGFYEKSSPNYVVPRFSTDASQVLYCGQSVTYINLQLAYFMGFTEVYLMGMDFSYAIPETHKRTGDVLLSDTDDPNHFHKDYFGKGKTWKDPKLDRVALNYRMAKLVFEATGRRIYNATVGGNLDIFERVDYEKLLRKCPATVPSNSNLVKGSFAAANALYREGRYNEALHTYVTLAKAGGDGPKFLYERSACDALRRANAVGQVCHPEAVTYVRGLKSST